MNQEISYTRVGDYLLPDIILREQIPTDGETREKPPALGRYGRMRRAFLREHCPIQYSSLVLSEQLFSHLREVDVIARERHDNGTPESIIVKEIICEY